MAEDIKFEVTNIDIVELLNSQSVVGIYRGKEAWQAINAKIEEVADTTLVKIDLRKANPLQYAFCQHAFGPLFEALNNKRWENKYIIFQLYDFHKAGFFRGVMKYLGKEIPRKESEIGFISADMSVKMIIGDQNEITFIGDLNQNEQRILEIVNEKKQVTVRDVVGITGFPEETVVDSFRALAKKYFVTKPYNTSNSHILYLSFYNYLN